MKKNTGITLVALVITIIILLILAGVAISMITGGEGLFAKANDAATKYNQAAKNEADLINQLLNGNYLNNGGNGQEEGPAINNESHVGYYADLDPEDGKIDGIIFADLAVGGSGKWGNFNPANDTSYTIPVKEGLKEYYISQTGYEGMFGTKDVLSLKEGSIGEDRFYIMALEDFSTERYTWYDAVYGHGMEDYTEATSVEFGTGRANTAKMIEYWNNKTYGEQNTDSRYKDMWGEIQEKVGEGWFVPSKEEMAAFAKEIGINYDAGLGASYHLWSSSQATRSAAWEAYVCCNCMAYDSNGAVFFDNFVRLATTF